MNPKITEQRRNRPAYIYVRQSMDLREPGASLNFLGYTFRYDRDRKGRNRKYLNVFPSSKVVQREREKLHEWMNYFSFGYPSSAYCEIER